MLARGDNAGNVAVRAVSAKFLIVSSRIGERGPLAFVVTVVLLLGLLPSFVAAPAVLVRSGVLVVATILAWATGILAESVASLLFFLFAAVFALATPSVIFSGFATPAWWIVFGGAITTVAVERTGLAPRLASIMFGRLAASYRLSLTAVAAGALVFAFLLPSSTARVMILMPIVSAFADRLGLEPGRPGRTGLMMTAAVGSTLPAAAILTSNLSNLVLLGAADTLYGIKISYASYLLLHFPVLGLLKMFLLVETSYWLFPERHRLQGVPPRPSVPMSADERMVAFVLAGSLLFFVTDVVHGISPAWVSLGAGLVCLLPGLGPLTAKSLSEVNLGMLIYMAAIIGVGAVIADTGLGTLLSTRLLQLSGIVPGNDALNIVIIAAIFAVVGLFTTLIGLPVVLAPLAGDFATASGLPVLTVLMLQVVLFSVPFFPYQNFLIVIGMEYGGVSLKSGMKFCLVQAVATILILFPLNYAWWRFLGYLQ
jgi:di/tricarboxylate transporter